MVLKDRKVTYRMYPTKKQEAALLAMKAVHHSLYNRALEERINVYKDSGKSLSFSEQCKHLTQWRAADPLLATINAQSEQVTLKRISLAFQAFFRRVANGQTPGFPRFKSLERFSGWGYKAHGDGWKLHAGTKKKDRMQHGKVFLSGIGMVDIRGQARTAGIPKTCEIMHKLGNWYISVTIECVSTRKHGDKIETYDWGVSTFLTVGDTDQNVEYVENPRFTRQAAAEIAHLQKELSRKKKGSNNRKKAKKELAEAHAKVARKRKDFLHKVSAKLVAKASLLGTEKLDVQTMTKKEKGGKRKAKAALRREILSTSPATFNRMVGYKAEEADIPFHEINTKKYKPTQTCSNCGHVKKKVLWEREHRCENCGLVLDRDVNAQRVIMKVVLALSEVETDQSGTGCSRSGGSLAASKHETPFIIA